MTAPPPPHAQGARVAALEAEAGESELRAALIEYNLSDVDAAINAVNAAIASGAPLLSWGRGFGEWPRGGV